MNAYITFNPSHHCRTWEIIRESDNVCLFYHTYDENLDENENDFVIEEYLAEHPEINITNS